MFHPIGYSRPDGQPGSEITVAVVPATTEFSPTTCVLARTGECCLAVVTVLGTAASLPVVAALGAVVGLMAGGVGIPFYGVWRRLSQGRAGNPDTLAKRLEGGLDYRWGLNDRKLCEDVKSLRETVEKLRLSRSAHDPVRDDLLKLEQALSEACEHESEDADILDPNAFARAVGLVIYLANEVARLAARRDEPAPNVLHACGKLIWRAVRTTGLIAAALACAPFVAVVAAMYAAVAGPILLVQELTAPAIRRLRRPDLEEWSAAPARVAASGKRLREGTASLDSEIEHKRRKKAQERFNETVAQVEADRERREAAFWPLEPDGEVDPV